jgi:hypothetical protein
VDGLQPDFIRSVDLQKWAEVGIVSNIWTHRWATPIVLAGPVVRAAEQAPVTMCRNVDLTYIVMNSQIYGPDHRPVVAYQLEGNGWRLRPLPSAHLHSPTEPPPEPPHSLAIVPLIRIRGTMARLWGDYGEAAVRPTGRSGAELEE